jgi:hypothetical protein
MWRYPVMKKHTASKQFGGMPERLLRLFRVGERENGIRISKNKGIFLPRRDGFGFGQEIPLDGS